MYWDIKQLKDKVYSVLDKYNRSTVLKTSNIEADYNRISSQYSMILEKYNLISKNDITLDNSYNSKLN